MIDTAGANVRPGGNPSSVSAETNANPGKGFPLPTVYINRDRDLDRRADIDRQLAGTGVETERISAVDALAVPDELRSFFFTGDKLTALLNPGEVGCYASHLKALRTITSRNLDYALILEDDAVVPSNIKAIVSDLLAHLPPTWDVVHMCGDARRATMPVADLSNGRTLVRYSRIPSGAFGYLVSRSGAAKLLKPMKRYWPFDTDLRRPWLFNLQVYGIDPSVIKHAGTSESVIIASGGRARARRGLPIPSRSAWTGNPLHCPEGAFFNMRTLGPVWWFRCWLKNSARRFGNMYQLAGSKRRRRAAGALPDISPENGE